MSKEENESYSTSTTLLRIVRFFVVSLGAVFMVSFPPLAMTDVDHYGIRRVVDMALARINPRGDRPLHLSFDIDGLDPTVCPSTGTAVRGGLSFREGRYIAERCWQSGNLKSMDVVEVRLVEHLFQA